MSRDSEPRPLPPDFEADLRTESWLERVRQAERPRALGRMGPYELLEEVGRGGQGIVYRARQSTTGRIVAVKRLLGGAWAEPAARRRFEREVRAGSALRHAALVTIFGVDFVDGQPLLAMEWIDGQPINRWAQRRPLDDVLRVFVELCRGIRHAHQHGVIHRDLKPGNVLIDADGQPRVLDFGLARLEQDVAAGAYATATSLFIGTPAYAAPEQISGDQASGEALGDVYSLGVVLYELLTGELPHPTDGGLPALFRAIETLDPPAPSTRRPGLSRELDAITLAALAKDRGHRYQSVDALLADVERHLDGEPVLAHPPSPWYQLRKIVGRHRLASALVVVIVLLVLAFAIGAAVVAGRLAHERDLANEANRRATAASLRMEDERDRASNVLDYLLEDVIVAALPLPEGGELTVKDLLAGAVDALDDRFQDRPLDEAEIRVAIAEAYRNMGRLSESEREHRRAHALRTAVLPADDRDVLRSELFLARAAQLLGRYPEAAELARATLAKLERSGTGTGEQVQLALITLGRTLTAQERFDPARRAFHRALEASSGLPEAERRFLPDVYCGLAAIEMHRGRPGAAEELYRNALDAERRLARPNPLSVAFIRHELGVALRHAGRLDEAAAEWTLAAEAAAERLGAGHLRVLQIRGDLASLLRHRGDLTRAVEVYETTLGELRKILPENHPDPIPIENGLANTLLLLGRLEEAQSHFEHALAAAEAVYGPEHETIAIVLHGLSNTLAERGEDREAKRLLERSMSISRRHPGESSRLWLSSLVSLATHALNEGRLDEAEESFERAWHGLEELAGPRDASTLNARSHLALVLEKLGEAGEARDHLAAVLAVQREDLASDHPAIATTHGHLGRLAAARGHYSRAIDHLRHALDGAADPTRPRAVRTALLLARTLAASGRAAEGRERLERLLGLLDERSTADPQLARRVEAEARRLGRD